MKAVASPAVAIVVATSPARFAIPVLAALLVAVSLAALAYGAVAIGVGQISAILLGPLGLRLPWEFEETHSAIVLSIRLPRVLLALLVGSALGMSGAALQGMFRNPLADPGLIGISAGAAFCAAGVIVLGATVLRGVTTLLGPLTLPAAAFIGGVLATLFVQRIGTIGGRTVISTMLLAGIAVNALCGAGTGFLIYLATDEQLRSLTFWTLGGLGGATWKNVATLAPCIALCLLLLARFSRALNALALGEAEAGHLGFPVERIKLLIVLASALAVGSAVAFTGIIGFIGLVVPHLLRLVCGPDHRHLLPGSALLGAALAVGADLAARTCAAPAELPIGIVTAAFGAPFLLWLLIRERTQFA